jgi:hypothetical protein
MVPFMTYQDPQDPVVACQMFLRGPLLSSLVQAGVLTNMEQVGDAARTLKRCWDDMFPARSLVRSDPPLPVSASPTRVSADPRTVAEPLPEMDYPWKGNPANDQYGPADMSDFMDWAGKEFGMPIKDRDTKEPTVCANAGKLWQNVTFQDMLSFTPEDQDEVGILKWYVEKLKVDPHGKYGNANIAKHRRIKAMLMEIYAKAQTPF